MLPLRAGTAAALILLTLMLATEATVDTDMLSLGKKIFHKIASGLKKSVIKAGNTCGVPKINNAMKNLTLNLGETARFQCSVDMQCMVSYIHWYHLINNGSQKLLTTGSGFSGSPYTFIIQDVTYTDEGFYQCMAGNILGETVTQAYLHISRAPTLLSSPMLLLLLLGL